MDKIIILVFILMVVILGWRLATTDTCDLPTQWVSANDLKECLEYDTR